MQLFQLPYDTRMELLRECSFRGNDNITDHVHRVTTVLVVLWRDTCQTQRPDQLYSATTTPHEFEALAMRDAQTRHPSSKRSGCGTGN